MDCEGWEKTKRRIVNRCRLYNTQNEYTSNNSEGEGDRDKFCPNSFVQTKQVTIKWILSPVVSPPRVMYKQLITWSERPYFGNYHSL